MYKLAMPNRTYSLDYPVFRLSNLVYKKKAKGGTLYVTSIRQA